MLPIKPYIAGNPVGETAAFIGRKDIQKAVLRVLADRHKNALVLFGQRRIGKTSALQYLEVELSAHDNYHPVYFDLQDKASLTLGQVLRDLAKSISISLGIKISKLGNDPETEFQDSWLPDKLNQFPENKSLVILFDEFDVLADPEAAQAVSSFFPYFRQLMSAHRQKLQFVFVMGRNIDDLSSIALSLFKGVDSRRVSLLSKADTFKLIELSQDNQTLKWTKPAKERVWQLTHGHPFLAQQLCAHIWDAAYEEEPNAPPEIKPAAVNAAASATLESSGSSLEWIWDGLPPAERVVISALAEAGTGPISQAQLEQILQSSGVRVVIRELQNAPKLLIHWDLIEAVDGEKDTYQFRVEIFRQWLAANKPLQRVQEELDRIEPVADGYFQAGKALFRTRQLDAAIAPLKQAIGINPNHLQANEMLAEIYLSQEKYKEAEQLLEQLYEYFPNAARPRLVQTYLAQSSALEDEEQKLALLEKTLNLSPNHPAAIRGFQKIWENRADEAVQNKNWDEALEAYKKIDSTEGIERVKEAIREAELERGASAEKNEDWATALDAYKKANATEAIKRAKDAIRKADLGVGVDQALALEENEKFAEAYSIIDELTKSYPAEPTLTPIKKRLEKKSKLNETYQRALGALQSDEADTAIHLFSEIIALEPKYKDAAKHLYQAVSGEDADGMEKEISFLKQKNNDLQQMINEFTKATPPSTPEKKSPSKTEPAQVGKKTEKQKIRPNSNFWNPLTYFQVFWWNLHNEKERDSLLKNYKPLASLQIVGKFSLTLFTIAAMLPYVAIIANIIESPFSVISYSYSDFVIIGLVVIYISLMVTINATKNNVSVIRVLAIGQIVYFTAHFNFLYKLNNAVALSHTFLISYFSINILFAIICSWPYVKHYVIPKSSNLFHFLPIFYFGLHIFLINDYLYLELFIIILLAIIMLSGLDDYTIYESFFVVIIISPIIIALPFSAIGYFFARDWLAENSLGNYLWLSMQGSLGNSLAMVIPLVTISNNLKKSAIALLATSFSLMLWYFLFGGFDIINTLLN